MAAALENVPCCPSPCLCPDWTTAKAHLEGYLICDLEASGTQVSWES
jgi:hypothetical protein